jgi:hypothetical protein
MYGNTQQLSACCLVKHLHPTKKGQLMTTKSNHTEIIRGLFRGKGPCITVVLAGTEAGDTATELRDALDTVREKLEGQPVDVDSLIDRIAAAGAESRGGTKFRGGIVILRSPEILQVYRVPEARPLVRVGDHFDVRTVISALAAQCTFYILALSQKRTRILKCTQQNSEEIPFPAGFATNLADAMQTQRPDHNLKNRASGGPSVGSGGVMFGTSSDRDDKDEYMLHFFMELDKGVNVALKGSADPLIPIGVEHEIALYRRVNTYGNLVEPGVHGAPDGLDAGEMHRRSLEMLQQAAEQPGREVPADFDKAVGTGHASTRIQEIVAAAHEGRVSHIFLQQNTEYLGTYDNVRQRVKHTSDPLDSPVDLIEVAAYQTILQGGEAKLLSGAAMPNGVPVCALFRYPAVETNAPTEAAETTI